jgi:HEAT repeat protein
VAVVVPAAVGLVLLAFGGSNVMHSALDTLAQIQFGDRWSHPELLKIRALGGKAVPDLRRVLREKDSKRTRLLFWVSGKWPGVTNFVTNFPEPTKLTERRRTACQVIRTLGPGARAAAPELIEIFRAGDIRDLNSASSALWAVGIDRDIAERLTRLMEENPPDNAQGQIIRMLAAVKPPTERTLKVLSVALRSPRTSVKQSAAEALQELGVSTPELVAELKILQRNATSRLELLGASAALWQLQKDKEQVLPGVFRALEEELRNYHVTVESHGGQGIYAPEKLFTMGGELFTKMPLTEEERGKALSLLDGCCAKSGRIFIRMLLLPSMLHLGFSRENALEVCRTGLSYRENYYRIQAARLMAQISEKHTVNEMNLNALLRDDFVGVRIYAAKAHWLTRRNPAEVVPVLIEALDPAKHQSYYYPEAQRIALETLRDIGPAAKPAIDVLEQMKTDPNPTVRKLVAETLKRIQE